MQSRIALVLTAVMLLAGCVTPPQQPLLLSSSSFSGDVKVGVVMTKMPAVDTYLPGAGCLLCMLAASVANTSLTEYSHTLPYEDLPQLKDRVADLVRKKGATQVIVISEPLDVQSLPSFSGGPNMARKDFSSLRSRYNVDKLVVIEIDSLGFWRTYSNYFPTSDPKAVMKGAGFVVNLSNNAYEWYEPVDILKSADGPWDESPKFPGLTNAYFQVIEMGKDTFTRPFADSTTVLPTGGSTAPL